MHFTQNLWQSFAKKYSLSDHQLQQCKNYYTLLQSWRQDINLTTIVDEADVVAYHFEDSLNVTNFYDFSACKGIADIGTGAGLPGIPLKIKFPEIPVVLVEVVQKKVVFLQEVIKELQLPNIEVCSFDWRTFLRQTDYPVDVVCARASLRPDELIRMFQPSSPYQEAQLIYWASADWKLEEKEKQFFTRAEQYAVGSKIRKYIFLQK